jgi:hypothetical protein
MTEEKRKVNSWVPVSLWEKVEKLGYNSPTRAVCDGLELLVSGHNMEASGHQSDIPGYVLDTPGHIMDTEIQALKVEIERLNISLREAPDPVELAQLRARYEEKDKQIDEKNRHLETLKTELGNTQETHRNYMMQMQTLINQKSIEAPGSKKPWWRFW